MERKKESHPGKVLPYFMIQFQGGTVSFSAVGDFYENSRVSSVSIDFTQPLGLWAYFLLAFVVILEGPIATLAGAVAASAGLMDPFGVFFAASLGNLTSDTVWYWVGYMGKTGWLLRQRLFGVTQKQIERLKEDIHEHAPKLLFMAKLTLGFSIPVLIATGMTRVPMRRWFWALVTAETLWTGTLVLLGYYFGRYLVKLERGVQIVAVVGTVIAVSALLFYISSFRRRNKKEE